MRFTATSGSASILIDVDDVSDLIAAEDQPHRLFPAEGNEDLVAHHPREAREQHGGHDEPHGQDGRGVLRAEEEEGETMLVTVDDDDEFDAVADEIDDYLNSEIDYDEEE